MPESIRLEHLHKRFGAQPVLGGVDLHIEAGEFVSLLGPSGCGKSTLLRIVAGLEQPDSGQVHIGPRAVNGLRPSARNVAMVFQNYALYPHLSVRDNVAMPLLMARLSLLRRQPLLGRLFPGRQAVVRQIHAEVADLATSLGLDSLLDRKPGQLSGGQRQRVALARAMVRQPAAFLMDEPLSNLDAKLRVQVRDELADLHQRLGATFVYVTHDQTEAMTLSNRVAVMQHGQILQVDAPQALYERPASLAVARFVGTPAINVLPLTARDGVCHLAGTLPVALHGPAAERLQRSGGHAAIRPEHLQLACAQQAFAQPVDTQVAATVQRAEHHGADWVVQVQVQAQVQTQTPAGPAAATLTVRVPQRQWPHARVAGSPVQLGWCWREWLLFDADEQRCEAVATAASGARHPAAAAA